MLSKADLENQYSALRARPDLLPGDARLLDELVADFRRSRRDATQWFQIHLTDIESRYTPKAIERRIRWEQKHDRAVERRVPLGANQKAPEAVEPTNRLEGGRTRRELPGVLGHDPRPAVMSVNRYSEVQNT